MTKDEVERDDQCDAMELMTDNEGDFVAVANHDNNHDDDSYNHVCADEIMLINSIDRYQEVQSKKRPGGII